MIGKQFVSQRATSLGASGIRRIFDLAASMTNPIDMSMGQPDFDTPEAVKQAAIKAIRDGKNGYTVTHGVPELRTRISAGLKKEFDWDPAVFVTCGVSGGLMLAMMACVNPGDEVLIGDPHFVSYPHLIRMFGGTPVMVDLYDDFALQPDRFEAAITDKTKMILINSPANPTGTVAPESNITAIAELAQKHDLLLASDEIYNLLAYEGAPASPVRFAPERTLLLRGFGKSYGMTGWRMGYAAGPPAVIAEMAKMQQYSFVCAPHMAQEACITALDTDVSEQVRNYTRKRDLAASTLKGSFEFARPGGGFFVFPKVPPAYESATAFVEKAIENNVLVIPGNAFSRRDTHFRISYALPDDKIVAGCEVLCSIAKG